MFVAPSPKNATRDARLAAQLERERGAGDRRQPAADDRVRAEVAALDVVEVHRAAVAVRAALELPVQLGHQLVRRACPSRACARARGASRRRRRRPPSRGRRRPRTASWPIATWRKPGQLAGAETLLDLLLEAPDQEHLAEQLAQPLLRERHWFSFPPWPPGGSLCCGPMALVDQLRQILSELPPDWPSAELALTRRRPRERRARAAALLGPLAPGRSGATIRFGAARDTGTDNVASAAAPARRRADRGHARARGDGGPGRGGRELEDAPLAAAWAGRARRAARRLERPVRRGRAHLERRPRSRRARARAAQPAARRRAPASASAARGGSATAPPPGWSRRCLERARRGGDPGHGADPRTCFPTRTRSGRRAPCGTWAAVNV